VSDRTLRQRLVPEIGDHGQERIAHAVATVTSRGLQGDVAARYLSRAGFAQVRFDSEIAEQTDGLSRGLVEIVLVDADPAVRAVALGANEALGQIRRAVKHDQ
jgi:hypothetical protein